LVGRYMYQDVAVSNWLARLRGGQPQRMNGRVMRRKLPQPELPSCPRTASHKQLVASS
jgi:hypothetical protein